jgi:hypothetical protein
MNQQSYEYNKEQLKNLGFGEEIAKALQTKMDQNLTEFTLPHKREFGKDVVESVLYFSKGDQADKDLTFFNRFDATLKKEGMEDLTQTFFVGQKYNYTLQERYNMMDGRYAYREQPKMEKQEVEEGKFKMVPTGETYYAWRGLDFKNADGYGNFDPKTIFWDHEKELKKYPIKGVDETYDLSRLLRPIEKGNRVDIVLLRDGQEMPAKVMANPRMMRFDFFDSNGQAMVVRQVEKQKVAQTEKVELTPQEVQRAAIAKAAEQKQAGGQTQNGTTANQPAGDAKEVNAQSQEQSHKESTKQQVAAEQQQQDQVQRRRQGVRV